MPEGQMFYSVTYGKNMMGSYASQLEPQAALDGDKIYQEQAGRLQKAKQQMQREHRQQIQRQQ
jgi:hypothetical protein